MKNNYLFLLFLGLVLFVFDGRAQVNLGVTAGGTSEICQAGTAVTLNCTYVNAFNTNGYTVSSIPPNSPFSTNPPFSTSLVTDDTWSQVIDLKGAGTTPFNFCFFGNTYSKCLLNTNGVISFSIGSGPFAVPGGVYTPGSGAGYTLSQPIPFNPGASNAPYLNAIHGVFQDTDPSNSPIPATNINYYVDGTYPNRAFIFSMNEVPNFSCSTVRQSSQIVMYEGTNIIDVYVIKRNNTCSWQGGRAVLGIQNNAGSVGFTPPGRNTGSWAVPATSPEAWRFTPTAGAPVPVTFVWKDPLGNIVGTGQSPTVYPTATTTYTVEATYTICGLNYTVSDDVTVTITDIQTGTPSNITDSDCDNFFDLTQNTPTVMASLNPSQYVISYHTTEASANGLNDAEIPAGMLSNYFSLGQPIWVAVEDFFSSFACRKVQLFNLIPCGATPSVTVNSPEVCQGTSATVTATPLIPGTYTYTWTVPAGFPDPGSVPSFSTTVAGTYSVIITDTVSGLSSSSASGVVTINPLPTVTVDSPTVCAGNNATITATPGSAGAYVYSWTVPSGATDPGNTPSFSTATAGTYSVIITDTGTNCSSASASGIVTINALPTISGTLSACQNATSQLTGSGTPATSNPWTSSTTAVATVDASGLVTAVSAGTTTITYTDNNGCFITATFTVNPLPTISGVLSACQNATSLLTATGTPAAANAWTSSNTGVATINAATGLVTGVSAGTTTITYTDVNGCSRAVVFTVNALPTVSGPNVICVNGTTSLTGTGTPAAVNAWTSSNTAVATVNGSGVVTGVSAGAATITFTDVNGCANTINVTVNALPTISGTLSGCIGTTTQLTGSGTPAALNPWTSSNAAVATVNASGLVTFTGAGSSVITYTDINGCSATATVTTTPSGSLLNLYCGPYNNNPTYPNAIYMDWSNIVDSSGNTIVMTFNYSYSINGGPTITGSQVSPSSLYVVTNGLPITFTVSAVGPVCVQTETVTCSCPTPNVTGTLSACVGSTTLLTGAGTPHPVNPWVSSNTAVATVNASGLVTGVSVGTANITYTNDDGCFRTVTVTINALPTISGINVICANGSTTLTGTGTPAATNAWTSSNTAVATVNGSGVVSGVSAGTTTITYTNNLGCTATVVVTVNALPTISGTLSACPAGTSTLTGSATPAATNAWTSSNTAVATINATTGVVTGVASGTTTITYTNANGCSITAVFTVNTLPTISGTLSACINGTSLLSGTGTPAAVNAWTSSNTAVATINAATGLVTGISAGTTTITYTNTNGCSGSVTFTVNALPTVSGPNAICINGTTQLSGTGTPAATNAWSSSNTAIATVNGSGLVTGVSAGIATITFTDANGCSNTRAVTVNALPTISGTLSACIGATRQLTGSPSPAAANAWTSSNTAVATISAAGLVTGVSAGTTTITYTNNNGCQITAVFTVNASPTISGTLSACVGGTTQLSGSGTPAAANAWTSSNTAVATVNATGLVTGVAVGATTITFTDANGCSGTAILNVLPTPTATIAITGPSTICSGTTANITITGTPNTTVNYTVNGASSSVNLPASGTVTFATASLSVQTTYQLVSVSTGSGCTGTLSQSVVVNIAPQPTALISGTTTICNNSSTTITFSGTPGATVEYTVNGGGIQTVVIGAGGSTPVNTGALNADTTYALVNVIAGTAPNCTQSLSGSAIVTVVQTPTVTAPATVSLCSGLSTGIQLTGTVPNTTFTWTYTQTGGVTGASNGSGNIISQVLTAGTTTGTVTYTITPSVGSCVGTPTTVTVTVTPIPVVNTNPLAQSICSGETTNILLSSNNAATTFSWNVVQTGGVTGGTSGTGNVIADVLVASGNTVGQLVYAITPMNNGCQGITKTVTVSVYPKPIVTATPPSETICSGTNTNIVLSSNVAGTTFSWTVVPNGVFGAASGNGALINQTLSITGSTPRTAIYTITPVVNGCVGDPITVPVTVNPTPEVFGSPGTTVICSGANAEFSLTPNIPGTTFTWTVNQQGVSGAFDGSGNGNPQTVSQQLQTTGNAIGTVTYTVTPSANGCNGTPITITFTVHPLPTADIPDGMVCIDAGTGSLIYGYPMNTGLSEATHDFQWYFGTDLTTVIGTGSSYTATQAGQYTVSIVSTITPGCSNVLIIDVVESNPAQSATAYVSNYFEDSQSITVSVVGNGSYQYSLDGGPFQTSNVFPNVLPGEHTVTVQDINGCTDIVITNILTIGYPHFFTPNGDGYNDTWNIWSLEGIQPNAEIHIYDRYGKLIKQMVPAGTGWDGTYNGQLLPSTDYWFTVKYLENGVEKLFKAHFSMKR
ncbi:hypothetical protein FSS13T_06640 [Flavobacterium saliperosum S13]|uniref:Gliding motility-associated C-terminal domain-containing protein n=2 Tax=Flavobacterium saliperosum TaxID=329186 RepID=A0A1G4VZF4_9FLAO|nr:Ig-like domain-containing protein [Flavobacterium saliperosum]ESU27592.1 hypothetical protein FSS13T_06640 [Flavobacterium saliperosum S13]SCX14334.1 gliding motility-associated C-terminal domain-containing protein [Flavobacterium saliperosum]